MIAQVERIKPYMERQGIIVTPEKEPEFGEGVTNILIGVKLLAVVTRMLRKQALRQWKRANKPAQGLLQSVLVNRTLKL